jgi:hypothetical protein
MALEKAFEDAVKALQTQGGLVTVVLGKGVEAPSDWSYHPRVHWVLSGSINRQMVPGAIPTNTKLMLLTENIDGRVFQPIHDERKRRRLPYMIRKSAEAVADELKHLFPDKYVPAPTDKVFSPMPDMKAPSPEGSNGNGNGTDQPSKAERGSLKKFLEENANLSASMSTAEEARRLFKMAQIAGLPTTVGSINQGITLMKRKRGLGSRPESATPRPEVSASVAVATALENAIIALQGVLEHVRKLDTTDDDLRKENEDLKTRIGLMKEAFAGIGG